MAVLQPLLQQPLFNTLIFRPTLYLRNAAESSSFALQAFEANIQKQASFLGEPELD